MMEALQLGFGLLFLGGLLFGFAYVVRALIRERVPQEEIDREARQLLADHGADALSVARGNAERSQWSKGRGNKIERSRRVLKEVERSAEFHQ